MVVKDGKIYFSLREIAPSSPYSADYLRIRILQGKLRGTKFGREWYTAKEWLAEYLSRYGKKIARASVERTFPVRYAVEKQFVPLVREEDALALDEPAGEAAAAPVRMPVLPGIGPPLGKTIYDFEPRPIITPTARVADVSPDALRPTGRLLGVLPSFAFEEFCAVPSEAHITRRYDYRALVHQLSAAVPRKLLALPLIAAMAFLLFSPLGPLHVPRERVWHALSSAGDRIGAVALEARLPDEAAFRSLASALADAPERFYVALAGFAAAIHDLPAAVGDFAIEASVPQPGVFRTANFFDAVRDLLARVARQRLPDRLARLFNLSTPPLTAPQANTPVRIALTPQAGPLPRPVTAAPSSGIPSPSGVRRIVETTEVLRPADVSSFQSKLDELNAGLRGQVLKLVTDVANLYVVTDRKVSIVTSFAPSQSIDELQNLKVDSGLTIRSGDLNISAGSISISGTNSSNFSGPLSASSLSTGGLLEVSGSGTSTISRGLTLATSGGSVGLGTSSPSQFFAVSGHGYFTGGLGLGTVTTSPGGLQTTGMAVIGSNLDVRGSATSTFAGPVSIAGILTVNSSALTISSTSTVTTQFSVTRAPVTAHTFASWAIGAANSAVTDATLLINPVSAASDTNLFGLAVNGSPRFLVDAEGDVYARNLILEGATTQASTTVSGAITIEGSATLGDAANADTHIIRGATILYATVTSPALTVWNSTRAGDLLRLQSGATSPTTDFVVTAAGQSAIGTTTSSGLSLLTIGATTTNSVALTLKGVTGQTGNLFQVLNSADAQLLTLNSSGLLGIGTSSPGSALAVNGPGIFVGTSTVFGGLNLESISATGTLGFYTRGTAGPRMVIDPSGNVGIGTSGPAATFSAVGSGYLTGGLGIGEATTSSGGLLVKGQGVFAQTLDVRGAGTSTYAGGLSAAGLRSTSGLESTAGDFLLTGGKIISTGAGTSTFSGGLQGTFLNLTGTAATSTASNGFNLSAGCYAINGACVGGGAASGWTPSGTNVVLTTITDFVGIGTATPGAKLAVGGPFLAQGTSTINGGGLIAQGLFSTTSLNFYTASNAAPRLTIDSTGLLGIGTTAPSHLLTLRGPFLANGTSTIEGAGLISQALFSTTSLNFYTASNATPRLTIDSAGQVGINIVSPGANLEVVNSAAATTTPIFISNLQSATSTAARLTFRSYDINSAATSTAALGTAITQNLAAGASADLQFLTLNAGTLAERMRITSAGLIGIGTTSPSARFSITGEGAGTGRLVAFADSANVETITILDNGFVGIGIVNKGNALGGTDHTLLVKSIAGNPPMGAYRDTSTSNVQLFNLFTDVGGTGNRKFNIDSDGDIFTDGATTIGSPSDVAENYPILPGATLEPGDIASLTETLVTSHKVDEGKIVETEIISGVTKSSGKQDSKLLGIVSTRPGLLLSGFSGSSTPVALIGRVPVKVSTESGPIKIGDRITSSSIPGTGMKATKDGVTVGIALEPFDGATSTTTTEIASASPRNDGGIVKTGKILVFVNLGYSKLDSEISGGDIAGGGAGWTLDPYSGRITTVFDLDLTGHDIMNVRSILSQNGSWRITPDGHLVAETVEARRGLTTYDTATGQAYCIRVTNGAAVTIAGKCADLPLGAAPPATAPTAASPVETATSTATAEPVPATTAAPTAEAAAAATVTSGTTTATGMVEPIPLEPTPAASQTSADTVTASP